MLTPKQLDEGLDRMSVRATMIGAAFHGQYNKLPKTDLARVCWEVGCFFFCIPGKFLHGVYFLLLQVAMERSVPAEILPRKAKMWLLKHVTLKAKTAHRLKP